MAFQLGDRVQISAAYADRGAVAGWTGYVTEILGGPESDYYRVTRPYGSSLEQGDALVPEDSIVAGPLVAPVFHVEQSVTLGGESGVITAISGGMAEVLIPYPRSVNDDVSYSRTHFTSLARLALEN